MCRLADVQIDEADLEDVAGAYKKGTMDKVSYETWSS